ncbi:glutamine amidotransferase-related protein [Ancylobacter oerskovii]|uniref:Gamma-glutamyl-gamma-aminobutyrate hydrolase family protein n=1 Tax=Ancylobacter oerskovii TaxID=459519 RepID=A0ABW4YU39_9HYPH|nr:gamma-glutamyl-gamma-aminobutyrate hydrolase family protein [Ancylobacter oerskovii]MBS7543643.1 gamma-glutamyl-gamma-aminobutyrate hydrolase family protein [Ancylobacter oerskovii]
MRGRRRADRRRSAVAIRHVAFEDLGGFARTLDARGWSVSYCEASTDQLSHYSIRDADLVIVLDGPIGVGDQRAFRFLASEMHLIERRLSRGQPTLGIGLGAQLMAAALGGRVEAATTAPIGWGEVSLTPEGRRSALAPLGRPGAKVLHWRGDGIELPPGARRLAFDAHRENQAFACGGEAGLALQFHLEADPRGLEEWYVGHAVALAAAGIDVRQLRRQGRICAEQARDVAEAAFGCWVDARFPESAQQGRGTPLDRLSA